jgi:hypothetical protein
MFPSKHPWRSAAAAAIVVLTILCSPVARAQDEQAKKTDKLPPLVPCLAVAADGTPVWASRSIQPSKRLTAAFRLKPDESATKLTSRWISLGDSEKVVAENTLDLNGQKTGWLQLQLKEPAPPGKYRLEALLDGKPWQSVNMVITPPVDKGKAEKPADLLPMNEGSSMSYEMSVMSGKNTKVEIPDVKPDPDGVSRATLVMAIGKAEDVGTPYTITINDKPVGQMWVKVDEKGLQAYRKKENDKTEDLNPPVMIQPLPPKLEDGTEWTSKTKEGDEQRLRLHGPLWMLGPEGPTAGYLVFGEQEVVQGSPGTEASRGKETTERYYIPKVGLVREVHVNTLNGEFTSRQEIVAGSRPYKLVANPNMKGRLGRLQVAYPGDTNTSDTKLAVFKAAAKDDAKPDAKSNGKEKEKAIHSGYGNQPFDLMPGKYEVAINNKRIPVEVKSGHDTVPLCGVLRVHASSDTKFRILDADQKTELHADYGEKDVALPVGTYILEISGATEPVKIEEGKVTEF